MGREVRRAATGFDEPLRKTWWGYLLPPIMCQSCTDGKNAAAEYGNCPVCEGERQVWPKVEPPAIPLGKIPTWQLEGYPGWQMWETTSEGSPISPVCSSPEALAKWLTDNHASAFGGMEATYDHWLAMIRVGDAPSAVFSPKTGLISGVEGIARHQEQ